jgi:hypothetical protein
MAIDAHRIRRSVSDRDLIRTVAGSRASRPFCLLANDEAEEVKHTTIAFRTVMPGLRVEAVYSADEALAWAAKEEWHTILFAERLASQRSQNVRDELATILAELRARSSFSSIIVLGEQDDAALGLMLAGPAADYYWTRRLGHASAELAMLAMHLAEKHRLRQELHAACRHTADQDLTMDLLGNFTLLLHSLMDYYNADRHTRGTPAAGTCEANAREACEGIPKKIAEVEEVLVDLHGRLAMRRQRDERARLAARDSGAARQDKGGDAHLADGML